MPTEPKPTSLPKAETGAPIQRRARTAFIVWISTIVFVAVIIGILMSLIVREVKNTQHTKDEFATTLEKFDQIADLNRKEIAARALRGEIEKKIPQAVEVPTRVLPLVNALAQQYGLTLDLQIGKEIPDAFEGGGTIDFSAKAIGGMNPILNFIGSLENTDTSMHIQNWVLTATGSTGQYQLSFSGVLYTRQ